MKQILLLFALLFAMNGNANASTVTNTTACDYYVKVVCAPPGNCTTPFGTPPVNVLPIYVFVASGATVPLPSCTAGPGPIIGGPYVAYYMFTQVSNDPDCPGQDLPSSPPATDLSWSLGPENCNGANSFYYHPLNPTCGCWDGHTDPRFRYDPATGNLLISY